MNKLIIVIVGMFFVFSAALVVYGSTQDADNTEQTSQLTMANVNADLAAGASLVDVRTPQEFAAGYIERAQLFPLGNLEQGLYPEVDKNSKIYVYCRSGNRSAEATKILTSAGFTDVVDLGGVPDVQALGGLLVR